VLDREPSIAALIIRLLLLTGMRRGEAFELRWSEGDFERRVLRLGDSKTGQKTVPLSGAAVEVLMGMPRVGECVFPGRAGYVRSVQRVWFRLRREAGLADMPLHTLRHSWASFAVAAGVPLAVIGAALGHRNPATTQRYAHVRPEAALDAAERVQKVLGV
jgi:integrase